MTTEDKSAKAWYVSCSPRSPEKIRPELELMREADGVIWDGVYTISEHKNTGLPNSTFNKTKNEFETSKKNNQNRIAKKLAELADFKGDTHEKEVSFSIRDRVAPMKTYGFLFTNSKHRLIITPAGNRIIENRRPKEVFLKQFLKWQYPSYQHGTARPHPAKYPQQKFNIFPFIATLKLIKNLDGLTKYEIAIFVLTTRKFEELLLVEKEIKNFRDSLAKINGKNSRKQFIHDYHYNRFEKIYGEEYAAGKKIREGKTEDGYNKYVETKIRNSYDIADASIRYFRYSGILSSRGNRITLLKDRVEDIEDILARNYTTMPYKDVDNFYQHYGDYQTPTLKYENPKIIIPRILLISYESEKIILKIKEVNPLTTRQLISYPPLKDLDIEQLKDIYYAMLQNMILLKRESLVLQLQNPNVILDEIIPDLEIFLSSNSEINEEVSAKFLVDKNSVFEFVVWKAMISLGNAIEYKNNFIIDENIKIVHHAAGNQGDMECYYKDFILLIEVTTSSGVTQFNMEQEPITRHYETLQELNELPVYCLFIAKTINDNTYKEFYRYNKLNKSRIIPIELQEFIFIIKKQADELKKGKSLTDFNLRELMKKILNKGTVVETHVEWKNSINEIIGDFIDN